MLLPPSIDRKRRPELPLVLVVPLSKGLVLREGLFPLTPGMALRLLLPIAPMWAILGVFRISCISLLPWTLHTITPDVFVNVDFPIRFTFREVIDRHFWQHDPQVLPNDVTRAFKFAVPNEEQ